MKNSPSARETLTKEETTLKSESKKPHVYFKNLDGIRFIAASLVLLQHSFGFKAHYFGDKAATSVFDLFFSMAGTMGVNIFFILSGFLISYLLLTEKKSTGKINYKNFYIRRILRIWPLYMGYGLVLIFVAPFVTNWLGMGGSNSLSEIVIDLVFLLLFSVNYQLAFADYNSNIFEVSWSVCIEEQFYLIWPFLVDKFLKNAKKLILTMFVISALVRIIVIVYCHYYLHWPMSDVNGGRNAYDTNRLMIFDKFDLFSTGLFMALLYRDREKYNNLFKKIFHPAVQIIMIILSVVYLFSIVRLTGAALIIFDHYIAIVCFGYVILSSVLKNSIINFEYPLIKDLGKISYGIYIYHIAVCQIVMFAFRKFLNYPGSHLIYDVLYPLTNLIITCIVAFISYKYYESFFLKKKKKFTIVQSENVALKPI
ncbi:MAG TPA: acyltransferase [Parafilimonas sp.]|nr:acyltransferase [Parafilimonas sp.]